METFNPASNIWTLRYDQFGGICWQNSATQEIYYIPPGQPPTLPPRSLANGVGPNLSTNRLITPSSIVHPPEGFGGSVHSNSYSPALEIPETARVGAVSFVGCPQPHPSPSMLTDNGNQCFSPWGMPNAPRRYYPTEPYSTPAVTARTQAPPLQAGGTGVHVNNNSTLETHEAAELRSASIVEGMGPYPRPPTSRAEDATRGMPPMRSVNAPFPSLPPEPHLTVTTDDRAKASLLLGGGEGGQFDPSATTATETARLRPKYTAEDKEPHPSLPIARAGDAKHELTANSLWNAPRSSVSNDPAYTPDATRGAEASLIRAHQSQGYDEREQFSNNSVLGLTKTARLRPKAIAEDKKPHPSIPMARVEDAQRGLSAKSLPNAPCSNIPNDPSFTSDATAGAGASLIWGTGEREQSGKKSGQGVPDATRLRTAPIAEDKAPYSPTPMSRTEVAKHELPRKTLADTSPLNAPLGSYPTTSTKHRAKASLHHGNGEQEQFGNNSPTGVELKPESITMDSTASTKHRAKSSLRLGNGERELFGNNSTLEVLTGGELRPDSTAKDTKPRASPLVSKAKDAKYELSRKRLSNAPRRNITQKPPYNATASARAEAPLIWAGGEGEQFDNNSALEKPETAPESVLGKNSRSSASMSRAEEAKQWSRKRDERGNEYYFNIITGESQYKKPDCLKKYTCRR